ncbi:MAG: hypothetical protein WEF51_01710 [Chloroflexota bacterium]
MPVASGVSVHCFPSADAEFRATTQRLVARSWERIHSTDQLIAVVQAALRETYPDAIVRPRDAHAELGEPLVQTLYAFRDGRAA